MFKFYFELLVVQNNVENDADIEVTLVVMHVMMWDSKHYENLQHVESNVGKGKFDQKGISKIWSWELFIDDPNILTISNSCLQFFPLILL